MSALERRNFCFLNLFTEENERGHNSTPLSFHARKLFTVQIVEEQLIWRCLKGTAPARKHFFVVSHCPFMPYYEAKRIQ